MSDVTLPAALDDALLCYCTNVTFAELREACRAGCWPLPGKELTGRLCTGCAGDLRRLLQYFASASR